MMYSLITGKKLPEMKYASIAFVVILMLAAGTMQAQYGARNAAFFRPKLRAIYIEALPLGSPCAGLGLDIDAGRAYEDSDSSSSYGLGVRGWVGAGDPVSPLSAKFGNDMYLDIDGLLCGSLELENFSAALLTGYGYRIWDGESGLPSGHRLKIGVELDLMVLDGLMALRIRAMGAAPTSAGKFEYGPVALGLAFGWLGNR